MHSMTIWKSSASRSLTMVISGVSFNRPNFKKLEEAIRKGAVDCIVVKDLSRFSRNYHRTAGAIWKRYSPQLGIRFIAVNDAYDSLTGDPQSDSFVIPFKKPHQRLLLQGYFHENPFQLGSQTEERRVCWGVRFPMATRSRRRIKNQLVVDEAVSEVCADDFRPV